MRGLDAEARSAAAHWVNLAPGWPNAETAGLAWDNEGRRPVVSSGAARSIQLQRGRGQRAAGSAPGATCLRSWRRSSGPQVKSQARERLERSRLGGDGRSRWAIRRGGEGIKEQNRPEGGRMWIVSGFPTVFPKLSLHNIYYRNWSVSCSNVWFSLRLGHRWYIRTLE
jgi:hypothetical protein